MHSFKVPKFLFEVFGEKQSLIEVAGTIGFALIGTFVIYLMSEKVTLDWQSTIAYLLIADILAGCIANFTYGTNDFYRKRPANRLIFIAIHIHIIVIAWLLSEPLTPILIVWAYTIMSALLVNYLHNNKLQKFIAANLMCYGLILLVYLALPMWLLLVSIFFMIKVLFSFSVDHFQQT